MGIPESLSAGTLEGQAREKVGLAEHIKSMLGWLGEKCREGLRALFDLGLDD